MARLQAFPLVAVDIGNSRVKLGLFDRPAADGSPQPSRTLALSPNWTAERIESWLPPDLGASRWLIASVHRATATRLLEWLQLRPGVNARLLTAADVPLVIEVSRPDLVGLDRLVNAVAANRLRDAQRPAIVIDVGSAITVDLVSAAGAFAGGAILPGIRMSAQALHQFTDLLPLIDMAELSEPPAALGASTTTAMRSGLFWGAVGAIRELVGRLTPADTPAHVYLTGGAAPSVAELLVDAQGRPATYVPHLTLAGIALVAGGEA